MIVKKIKNQLEISFRYDSYLLSFIKSLDGAKYNPKTRCWFLPLAHAAESIRQLKMRGFKVEEAVMEAIKADEQEAVATAELAQQADTEFKTSLPLFPYQKVGAKFLYKVGSGLLGDDVGLGKTLQTLAVLEKNNSKRNLIVCPKVLIYQWEQEIRKFMPHWKNIFVVDGGKEERKKSYLKAKECEDFILIIGYEALRIDIEYLQSL